MNVAYARQKDGRLAAYQVPANLPPSEIIDAVKSELGVNRALVLICPSKEEEKEAA